jgi:hypothetical protein
VKGDERLACEVQEFAFKQKKGKEKVISFLKKKRRKS